MIEKAKIEEKVKEFILKTSYLPEDKITPETLIFAEGIMDSMGFISIINYIEETFNVTTNDDELIDSNFESIRAITDLVARKLMKIN